MAVMIFCQVQISKGFGPAIIEMQQRNFVSGLFTYHKVEGAGASEDDDSPLLALGTKGLTRMLC